MRILEADSQNPDSIKSLGGTPLGEEFPEGHVAEVVGVTEIPSAAGPSHSYEFETQEGVTFTISHADLEKAIEQSLITLH